MVGFDPTRCFVEDLKEFPNTFKVWYDSLGGDAIGLTWEKQGSKRREREDADDNSGEPTCMLKEVGEVGKGFVRSVYFFKAPALPYLSLLVVPLYIYIYRRMQTCT